MHGAKVVTEDAVVQIARIQERIGVVYASAEKAHSRIDSVEREIKSELKSIAADVKMLLAESHQSRGNKEAKKESKAAIMFAISTLIGTISAAAAVVKFFFL